MLECIYCRRLLSEADFNREHVISEAFGKFDDAPVLHNMVCRECNQFFGDKLEVRFTRGALEALLRYDSGLKAAPNSIIKLPFVEVTLPPGTDWFGVRLGLRMEDKLRIHLFAQVAFPDRSGHRWVHITAYDMERGALADTSHLDTSNARIFASSQEERDLLLSRLRDHGITFTKLDDFDAPAGLFDGRDLEVELTVTVNKGIRRCVAKYVFNYLAHECGAAFVLGTDFDPIRRFIRNGEVTDEQFVVENVPQDRRKWSADAQIGAGHIVAVTWAPNGFDLVGQISLFSYMSYTVLLARRYGGPIWRPISRGLHYDIRSKTVQHLGASSPSRACPAIPFQLAWW